jgi:uncharacterized protein YecT (DUF1311 family)
MPRGSEEPSFDCAKARSAASRIICADGELARLDRELGVAFQKRKAQISASDQPRFVADQLAWIRDRNTRCDLEGKSNAPIEGLASSKPCMVSVIRERIAFLTQSGSAGAAPPQEPLALLPAAGSETAVLPQGEIAALRAKLFSLWSPPATNVPNPYDVKIRIRLNRDGRLAEPPIVLTNGQTPLFAATRESAVRAIVQAQPFDMLSPATYDAWKEIEVNFAPREGLARTEPTMAPAAVQPPSYTQTAGYKQVTVRDLILDGKVYAANETKVSVSGFYHAQSRQNERLYNSYDDFMMHTLNPSAFGYVEALNVGLITEDGSRTMREYLLGARCGVAGCGVTILGHVGECVETNAFGRTAHDLCLLAEDMRSAEQ